MAIQQSEQRLVDGTDRAVISLTGIFDGSQLANNTIIDVSTLRNALNANGFIMSANTDPKTLYRTTIKKINYSLSDGTLRINWQNSTGNIAAWYVPAGSGEVNLSIANPDTANSSGDIQVTSQGTNANSRYSLVVTLKKDPRDFDAGQTADPAAFNKGAYRFQ